MKSYSELFSNNNAKYFYGLPLLLGSMGFAFARAYSYWETSEYQIFVGIWVTVITLFILALIRFFVLHPFDSTKVELSLSRVLLFVLPLYLGLLFGYWIDLQDQVLWPPDAAGLHLPGVHHAQDWLTGKSSFLFDSVFGKQINFTYIWIAPFFMLFGEAPWVSALALLIVHVFTWILAYRIGRRYLGERGAFILILLMALLPTQIYYTMVFYKDPVIQLCCMIGFETSLLIYESGSILALLLSYFGLIGLSLERFYFVPLFLVSQFAAIFFCKNRKDIKRRWTIYVLTSILFLFLFVIILSRDFPIFGWQSNIDSIKTIRSGYMGYGDVDKDLNANLIYPLALVKIYLTPFFTFDKMKIFNDISALLAWGSFVYQILSLIALRGIWRSLQKDWKQTLIILLPWVCFLLIFAYMAPYSGRQRDTMFFVVAFYATIEFQHLFRPKQELH